MRFILVERQSHDRVDQEVAGRAHALAPERVLEALGSDLSGLARGEASRRARAVAAPRAPRAWRRVLGGLAEALTEPLQLLLIAVGVLSFVFGQVRDAVAIFVIICLVAGVEAVSEARARRALSDLRRLSSPRARIRRAGAAHSVAAAEVVVGDIVLVAAGDVVPADCRVLEADGLAVDESTLTGEPVGALKGPAAVEVDRDLAERSSVLYASTGVLAGSGVAVAVATGSDTELGRLGALAEAAREPATALQRSMAELARAALVLALAASVLVPVVGVLRGQPVQQMLLDGLTLAFATIPEELPILITVLVAVGGLAPGAPRGPVAPGACGRGGGLDHGGVDR